jgi:Zn-dependent peptidase ImmA (M78 family)
MEIELCTPHDIIGLPDEAKNQLLAIDPSGWSAVTIQKSEKVITIYNPMHSPGRQASDITHEIAHVILGHKPATLIMSNDGQLVMRSYDQQQEDEANCLAWSLLLPREGLLYCRRNKFSSAQIAERFGVSEKLVQYRVGVTGIEAQLRRSGRL